MLRYVGYAFFFLGLLLFCLGLWTYAFVPTDANIHHFQAGSPSTSGSGRNMRSHIPPDQLRYSYAVNGKRLESDRVGMGFRIWTLSPLGKMDWEIALASNQPMRAYYSSVFPTLAVLHRGFDIVGTFVFLFIGYGLQLIQGRIDRYGADA